MIFRLSQKLNSKIGAGVLHPLPLDENPFVDWSAHLFSASRTQYILLSNTRSLYSTVMHGQGITNDSRFIERALSNIREFIEADEQAFVYHRLIAPASGTVRFAKALDRSVTGSMNDLVKAATMWLIEGELSPCDVGFKLNEIPFSSLKYLSPRVKFKNLVTDPRNKYRQKVVHLPLPRKSIEGLKEIHLAISDSVNQGMELNPLMAFALCYVTAHLALDLIDEKQAEANLNFCEEHLEG